LGNSTDFEGCNIDDDDDDDDKNDAVIGGILPHILEHPSNPPLALLDRQLSSGVGFGGERDRVGEWGMKGNRGMKKGTDCRIRVRDREGERREREVCQLSGQP